MQRTINTKHKKIESIEEEMNEEETNTRNGPIIVNEDEIIPIVTEEENKNENEQIDDKKKISRQWGYYIRKPWSHLQYYNKIVNNENVPVNDYVKTTIAYNSYISFLRQRYIPLTKESEMTEPMKRVPETVQIDGRIVKVNLKAFINSIPNGNEYQTGTKIIEGLYYDGVEFKEGTNEAIPQQVKNGYILKKGDVFIKVPIDFAYEYDKTTEMFTGKIRDFDIILEETYFKEVSEYLWGGIETVGSKNFNNTIKEIKKLENKININRKYEQDKNAKKKDPVKESFDPTLPFKFTAPNMMFTFNQQSEGETIPNTTIRSLQSYDEQQNYQPETFVYWLILRYGGFFKQEIYYRLFEGIRDTILKERKELFDIIYTSALKNKELPIGESMVNEIMKDTEYSKVNPRFLGYSKTFDPNFLEYLKTVENKTILEDIEYNVYIPTYNPNHIFRKSDDPYFTAVALQRYEELYKEFNLLWDYDRVIDKMMTMFKYNIQVIPNIKEDKLRTFKELGRREFLFENDDPYIMNEVLKSIVTRLNGKVYDEQPSRFSLYSNTHFKNGTGKYELYPINDEEGRKRRLKELVYAVFRPMSFTKGLRLWTFEQKRRETDKPTGVTKVGDKYEVVSRDQVKIDDNQMNNKIELEDIHYNLDDERRMIEEEVTQTAQPNTEIKEVEHETFTN